MNFDLMSEKLNSSDYDFLNRIFNIHMDKLPHMKEWTEKRINSFYFREEYTKKLFPIINHEFMIELKNTVENLNIDLACELSCGTGYFSHWAIKYGLPMHRSIDNKTWHNFKRYLPHVTKDDSVKFVKRNPGYQMFILSWPYMDDVAFNIYRNMKKGQYLLYIGESMHGCTANDKFFRVVYGKRTERIETNLNNYFLQFYGIHDYCYLFKKL